MYSDGKLSVYPAGSGLAKHFGSARKLIELNQIVLDTVSRHCPFSFGERSSGCSSAQSQLAAQAREQGVELKCYDVIHLGTEGIQVFCASFEAELRRDKTEFRWNCKVRLIVKHSAGFHITYSHPRRGKESVIAKKLVIATGKASGLHIRKHYETLGVSYHGNKIELGVRVETSRGAVLPFAQCHLDTKFKLKGLYETEIRTFCVCDGGYIVSCYYEDFLPNQRICTLSGFSFREKKSSNSNFGLLVRKKFPIEIDQIRTQLELIQRLNIASGHGGTVVQRYGDFAAGQATTTSSLESNSIKSTLPSSTPVDLSQFLPSYIVENIRLGMQTLADLNPSIGNEDTLLHAPVWELVHDRPVLSQNFETTVQNLYIIGDATGIARGIVQAATTGLWAARHAAWHSGLTSGSCKQKVVFEEAERTLQ